MNLISELVNRLNKFFNKVLYEKQIEHYMIALFRNDKLEYTLCIDKNIDEYFYGKIVSINKTSLIDCLEILYNPYGLFIFARNIDEFIDKLMKKIKKI